MDAASRARPVDDTGFGLLELVISMAILTVFGTIVTAASVQLFRLNNRSEQAAQAQSQLTLAFMRLDNRIRYASGISTPGHSAGGDWYVEYLTSNTGTEMCGQLRLTAATASLQWREWPHGATPGGWTTLATDISSAVPFAYAQAGAAAYPALTVSLTSSIAGLSKQFSNSFPALNATPDTDTSTQCVEGRTTP